MLEETIGNYIVDGIATDQASAAPATDYRTTTVYCIMLLAREINVERLKGY
ncbi:MAG TPA: hypothetical protein H9850_08135 [Candidatus Anaerobiospirillum pullistercoris]|uniref:Uncharacterized protein n=1 Tax=Candidatus Anaerobiospirillum pullistercoris TaxID=2838452 RepID=A0A9D1WFU8_9GAMM|nr:hypothetical protein [Candidatus Anaerobiospirillum pullistercoris]